MWEVQVDYSLDIIPLKAKFSINYQPLSDSDLSPIEEKRSYMFQFDVSNYKVSFEEKNINWTNIQIHIRLYCI